MTQYMSATTVQASATAKRLLRPESLAVKLPAWSSADFTSLFDAHRSARPCRRQNFSRLTARQKESGRPARSKIAHASKFLFPSRRRASATLSLDRFAATLSGGESPAHPPRHQSARASASSLRSRRTSICLHGARPERLPSGSLEPFASR